MNRHLPRNFIHRDEFHSLKRVLRSAAWTLIGAALFSASNPELFADEPVSSIVFASGDPVPGESPGTIFRSFGQPSLDSQNVGFLAMIGLPTGMSRKVIWGGSPSHVLLHTGDFAPDETGTDFGAIFANFKDPVFGNGRFACIGAMKVGMGSVTSADDAGVWSNANGTLRLVARENGDAPDTDLGLGPAKWKTFISIAMPQTGGVILVAKLAVGLDGEAGPGGTTADNDWGIWRETTGGAVKVLREGDVILTKTVKSFSVLGSVAGTADQRRGFRSDGTLIILVQFTDGVQGILKVPADGSSMEIETLTGDLVNIPETVQLAKLSIPSANEASESFLALLKSGIGGVVHANELVLFTGNGTDGFTATVRKGEPAPDAAGNAIGGKFRRFGNPLLAGSNNNLSFTASLSVDTGAPPVTENDNAGLWTNAGGTLHQVARKGNPAPGTSGALFTKFLSVAVDPAGTEVRNLAFTARLQIGVAGVTSANATGLWARDKDDTVHLLARNGSPLLLPDPTGPVVTTLDALKPVAGSPGQGRGTNDSGQIVYRAKRGSAGQVIVKVQMP